MLDSIKSKIENLELIASNFNKTQSGMCFIKEKMAQLREDFKVELKFDHLLIAMSNNGGLIAICKKKNYFDEKKTIINSHLIVMHQNAETRYFIPLNWDYTKRYIVSLEFNQNEQLYGFCNDGTLLKIDILRKMAVEKLNSAKFKDEGIDNAKIFEKGFIALTSQGNIYLVKDIKNPYPIFIISVRDQLNFSNNINYLGIPSSKSYSKKFELLIINEKGKGVLHIEQQDEIEKKEEQKNDNKNKDIPVSILIKNLVPFKPNKASGESEWERVTDAETIQRSPGEEEGIGKISAMAMSPSKKQIAFYNATNSTIYCFPSNLDPGKKYELKFDINSDDLLDQDEIKEIQAILAFNNKYQLFFCTEDIIGISGQRFIILVNKLNETISFKVIEGFQFDALSGISLFKCFPEIDGVRFLTKDSVYLISKVSNELYNICEPFSDSSSKKLIEAYGNYFSKNADCDRIIRDIGPDLPDAIKNLQIAAANVYWSNDNNETKINKELQLLIIRAAQYGKTFVQKGDFNYDKFVENCRAIRIMNSLRNNTKPRFLTFEEYKILSESPSELIKKILRNQIYDLAYDISNYLGCDVEKVYLRFAFANIKILPEDKTYNEINKFFENLMERLQACSNISYITLAKKCIKYEKNYLAEKFLENEKSIVVKVPQYLQLKKWDKALELSLESYDRTVIKVVLDKIFKVEEPSNFIKIVGKFPKAHTAVIEYLRTHDKDPELRKYLGSQKDSEELLFMTLENFFKCKNIPDRKEYLKEAKQYIGRLLRDNPNKEFYKTLLDDMSHSLNFKFKCIKEKGIISNNDINPFDNSIYDCYKLGIPKDYPFIEKENKNSFELSQKKLTVLRFKDLASKKLVNNIDEIIKKDSYKKLDITPLNVAQILSENNLKDDAVRYIKEITDPNHFDEKINLLKKMEKYEDALEITISDKKNEKQVTIVNDILRIKPNLQEKVYELCSKYKVNLG